MLTMKGSNQWVELEKRVSLIHEWIILAGFVNWISQFIKKDLTQMYDSLMNCE